MNEQEQFNEALRECRDKIRESQRLSELAVEKIRHAYEHNKMALGFFQDFKKILNLTR